VLAGAARPDREALSAAGLQLGRLLEAEPTRSARERVLFTYDDHQAGTARQDAPGQPNRVRAVREGRWKYAAYLDPNGEAPAEHELYDLEADSNESHNLVERDTGRPRRRAAAGELPRLREALLHECRQTATPAYGLGR
jgi:arylsulfatase A-like enzyme